VCVQVVLELLISESGQLSPLYCSQTPHELHRQNIPTLLHHHLNHPDNAWLLPRLLEVAHRQGPAAVLLLRLLAAPLFSRGLYTATQRIARGAFSTVFRCSLPSLGQGTPATLALKVSWGGSAPHMAAGWHQCCNITTSTSFVAWAFGAFVCS
jgi:hypothetical protein